MGLISDYSSWLVMGVHQILAGAQQFAPLAVLWGSGSLKLEENGYIPHLRAVYLILNLVIGLTLWFIRQKIEKEHPQHPENEKDKASIKAKAAIVSMPEVKQMGQVVKPARSVTVREHDLEVWTEQIRQFAMNVVMLSFIHYKWEATLPIMLQSVTGPLQFLCSPLFQAYILGPVFGSYPGGLLTKEEETGVVKAPESIDELVERRPFPAPKSMFGDLANQWKELKNVGEEGIDKKEVGTKKSVSSDAKQGEETEMMDKADSPATRARKQMKRK